MAINCFQPKVGTQNENQFKLDSEFTCEHVLKVKKQGESISRCVDILKNSSKENSAWRSCDDDSLRSKISRLHKKVRELETKRKPSESKKILQEIFVPPQPKTSSIPDRYQEIVQVIKEKTKHVVHENRQLKRDLESLEESETELLTTISEKEKEISVLHSLLHEITQRHLGACQSEQKNLKKDNELWKSRYNKVVERLDKTNSNLSNLQEELSKYNTRNLNKKLKRRDEKLQETQRKIETYQNQNKSLEESRQKLEETEKKMQKTHEKLEDTKQEKHKLQRKVWYLNKSAEEKEVSRELDKIQYQDRIKQLQEEIKSHKERVLELEMINTTLQRETISTFEDGKFKNEVRETVMYLLTECNISVKKVNTVIETVLSNLAGKIPERLPSTGVKQRLLLEAKNVAACQVADAMLKNTNLSQLMGNCLHQDATSKFHHHYEGFQVTWPSGETYSIGLKEVAGGDAQTYLSAFNETIDDITFCVYSADNVKRTELKNQLISSIMYTMSDQAAVNSVFNNLLSNLRKECISSIPEFAEVKAEFQEKLTTMVNFSCRMHLLVNFASDANRILKVFEGYIEIEKNQNSLNQEECTASRMVRTASKAFTDRGSDKAGVSSYWESYLAAKDKENKLETYRGHRVNILFYDSAAAYYHLGDMQDFLSKWKDPNKLLQSVMFGVHQKATTAGVRALGILFKIVMEPFWNLLHIKGSILDLNTSLMELQMSLSEWSKDSSEILEGQTCFHNEKVKVQKDEIYEALFQETDAERETLTQMALELLCGQLLIMLERQAKDQLPGGQYWTLDEGIKERVQHVKKTNIISERDMAHVDRLVRTKPSGSSNYMETVIMWTENKPSRWLSEMNENEKNEILDKARKNAPKLQQIFSSRKEALKQKKATKLAEKQKEKEKKEDKEKAGILKLTNEISKTGGVWKISEIDDKVESLSSEHQLTALVSQLHYMKLGLKAKGPKELFQKSSKGHQYTIEELKANLKTVLTLNSKMFEEIDEVSESDILNDSVMSRHDMQKRSLLKTLQDARNVRKCKQQASELPLYLENPQKLVGKKVLHRVKESSGDTVEWFEAEVIGISNWKRDNLKTEYDVKYSEEPDDLFGFPLLTNMKSGDLLIL